jgi:hypothetical protein
VHDVVALWQLYEPGLEVTVYSEIEAPPLEAGAVHETND